MPDTSIQDTSIQDTSIQDTSIQDTSIQDIDFLIADSKQAKEQAVATPTQALLDIRYTLNTMLRLKDKIAALEEELKTLKTRYNRISQYDIPELFARAQIDSLTLPEGYSLYDIKVKPDLSVTIVDHAKLAEKLTKYGAGAVIKSNITLPKLPPETVCQLQADIQKTYNIDVEVTNTVHPQTLKKLVKELTQGETPCATVEELSDCLRIYQYNTTDVRQKRKS